MVILKGASEEVKVAMRARPRPQSGAEQRPQTANDQKNLHKIKQRLEPAKRLQRTATATDLNSRVGSQAKKSNGRATFYGLSPAPG